MGWIETGAPKWRGEVQHKPIAGNLMWQSPTAQIMAHHFQATKGADTAYMNRWGDELVLPEALGCGDLEGEELEACLAEAEKHTTADITDPDVIQALLVEGCARGGFRSCGRVFDRLQDGGASCEEAAATVEAMHPNIACGCPGRECAERDVLSPDDRRAQQTDDIMAATQTAGAWLRRTWWGVPAWAYAGGAVVLAAWMWRRS